MLGLYENSDEMTGNLEEGDLAIEVTILNVNDFQYVVSCNEEKM